MRPDEREEYLDRWGHVCYICGSHVLRMDMSLVESTVPLERFPLHGEGQYTHFYMGCPECMERKELV